MPIGYAIQEGLLYVRAWGELTGPELRLNAAAVAEDPRFDPASKILANLREATVFRISTAFIRTFVSPNLPDSLRAIVVNDDVAFGMSRMYGALQVDPDCIIVVRDLVRALEWLGLPTTYTPPTVLDATFGVEPEVGHRRA